MALGKAFIEVHADTRPFARELAFELDKIVRASEKEVRVSAGRVGETISRETGDGIRRNRRQISNGIENALTNTLGQGVFSRFAKGIVDSIDDGLSGLPAELKIALGVALIALIPFVVALGSAITAGLVAGISLGGGLGIGALLAAQFEEVRASAMSVFAEIRDVFLGEAQILVVPFLNGLELLRTRLTDLAPEFENLFGRIGDTVIPILDGILGFAEEFVPRFRAGFANIGEFLAPLQIGLRLIGQAAGDFFQTILENDDAPEAFYDMLIFVEDLIQGFTALVDIGLDFYGTVRDAFEFLGIVEPYTKDIEKFSNQFGIAAEEASWFGKNVEGTIAPLEYQEKAIEEVNKQLDTLTKLLFSTQQNEIDFERALDDLTESVNENGRSLNIQKEAGRQNAEALLNLANIAIQTRQTQIDLTGDVGLAQAAFEKQRAKIYEVAAAMGLSEEKTHELIGALLGLPPPKDTGVTAQSVTRMKNLLALLRSILPLLPGLGIIGSVLGAIPQAHADGGVFTEPHVGLVAEAGPEAIIPLNNPQRASQIMAEAGLSSGNIPTVNVYVGNQQFDAYIAAIADRQMAASARSMSYGTRGI